MAPFIHDLRTAVVAFPTASNNAATTTSHIKFLTGLDPGQTRIAFCFNSNRCAPEIQGADN